MVNERCLIIGGCGFLGSYAAESLLKAGYNVRIFDKPCVDTVNINDFINNIEFYYGDISNLADIKSAVKDVDYIFHFAGTTNPQTAAEDPVFDLESNVAGTLNLLETARRKKIQKIVFSSSGGTVYGFPKKLPIAEDHPTDPICAYGVSKLAIEKYLQFYSHMYNLKYVILRFANPYGPRQNLNIPQGAIVHFLHSIYKRNKIEIWGDGSVIRDYFFVKDLIGLFPKLLTQKADNKIFNIGQGRGQTLKQIIDIMQLVLEVKPLISHFKSRKIDIPVNYLKVTKVKNELGWAATTGLEEGIIDTWNWIRKKDKHG